MYCQVVFWPMLCIVWMQQTHHFSFWGKTWPQRMSNHLSRWQYTCIHQWRELAFCPDWNEPNWVVFLPSISKLGKEVSWTFLFHIPHRVLEVRQWFGEDHLLCFFQDVLSRIGEHVPFFCAIRYSHWLLWLLPMESHSCFDKFHVKGMESSWLGQSNNVEFAIQGYCCTLTHCLGHASMLSGGNQQK